MCMRVRAQCVCQKSTVVNNDKKRGTPSDFFGVRKKRGPAMERVHTSDRPHLMHIVNSRSCRATKEARGSVLTTISGVQCSKEARVDCTLIGERAGTMHAAPQYSGVFLQTSVNKI